MSESQYVPKEPAAKLIYAEESFVIDCLECICDLMQAQEIDKKELAKRMKTTTAAVTKVLRGQNVNMRTLAKMAHVLQGKLKVTIEAVEDA